AIVFAFELTRDYRAIVPLMLAAVVADLVAGAFLPESIMTEKLARRGLRVPRGYQPDVFASTSVGDAMTRDVVTVAAGADAAAVQRVLAASQHQVFPVVDADGACVGIVSREDPLPEPGQTEAEVVRGRGVATVASGDSLLQALDVMGDERLDQLPVVDRER